MKRRGRSWRRSLSLSLLSLTVSGIELSQESFGMRASDGELRVESCGWRAAGGELRVESCGWRAAAWLCGRPHLDHLVALVLARFGAGVIVVRARAEGIELDELAQLGRGHEIRGIGRMRLTAWHRGEIEPRYWARHQAWLRIRIGTYARTVPANYARSPREGTRVASPHNSRQRPRAAPTVAAIARH